MNQAATHLLESKELRRTEQNGDYYRQKGARTRKEKVTLSFFGGQKGSVRWVTSLLLTRWFQIDWSQVTFLGKVETAIRSVITSWFADVVLSTSDFILGLLSLFFFENSFYLVSLFCSRIPSRKLHYIWFSCLFRFLDCDNFLDFISFDDLNSFEEYWWGIL